MNSRFEDRLAQGAIVVADGGMGMLVSSAVPRLRCPEEANLRAPESVVTLHTSFIRAGADLIETNTFGANRRKLSQHYLEDEFERINSAGVKLAREAREVAGRDVFIAGSIGPLGDLAVPRGAAQRALRRAGVAARRPRDRPVHGRDVLRPRRARGGDRGACAASRACRSSRRSPSTRAPRRSPASPPPTLPRACGRSAWPRSARTTAPACTPRWRRSRRWAPTAARRSPRCRTSASPA